MSGIARVANFLSNRERVAGADKEPQSFVEGPAFRILSALQQYKMVSLTDIPKISGVPADSALSVVQQLISDGKVEVLEREDRVNEKYLSLRV
jgi:hypothetical protein